jgi:DNA polymerase III subunit alpha
MLLARSHSHYSLLSSVPKIKALIQDAKKKGYTTIALTDEDTSSGWVEFYDTCKEEGINPALGVTIRLSNISDAPSGFSRQNQGFSKVVLIAKNTSGYKDLLELISLARTQKEEPVYHLDLEDLKSKFDIANNLFVSLVCDDHEFHTSIKNSKTQQSEQILAQYLKFVPASSLLIELINPDYQGNEYITENQDILKIANQYGAFAIASPGPRFLDPSDEEAFKVVLAIKKQVRLDGISLQRDFQLPSKLELEKRFPRFTESFQTKRLEDQINIEILTNYDKHADDAFFPKFILPSEQAPDQRLRWETYIGLFVLYHSDQLGRQEWENKYPYNARDELFEQAKNIKPDPDKLGGYDLGYWDKTSIIDYIERMEYELNIIITKGYADYFLVFGDIMRYCRSQGIVTNTRGSAAGSLVGYLNNINVLDPLRYNIPFERFLNPFRPSPPDIDGDFADDRRDNVIEYITSKYGSQSVSQIVTFGTMLPRAAVRDVGRVLGIPYKKCDRLSKLIPTAPQGRKTTFAWAFETSAELKEVYENDTDTQRIINIALKIEGNHRHASSHAAGLLITPTKLTDYTALQWDSDHKMIVAQYDMKVCEKVGLVKLDILGITNLAILGNAIELTKNRRGEDIDLLNINTHDKKAFELLAKGRTMGTFQLSGGGMTRWLIQLQPTKVEDLMAMVALYRPGPMASIPEYITRKKDPKKIKYLVPEMKEWMEASYGIFVYQEDLLMTAINLAGYNWGEADVLRKGMGKKIQAVIEEQHPKFVDGAIKNGGLSREKAEEIWQLMVPFGAYGFNKAHSSSYGMVAYWTAYMKAEYTVEFMTAYMTAESNNLDKIASAISECKEIGVSVLPPDVNKSFDSFTIENDSTIRYGLSSVKNLGSDVIRFIISEREKNGNFESIEDLVIRMSEYSGFNKRSLEALILSGSLDLLGEKTLSQAGVGVKV